MGGDGRADAAAGLRDLYGRNGAETISGLCGTRVVLASPDRDTAQWSADSLGRAEVEEVTEGFSYGANTIRDGVSLTPKRELRALALASEIMRLANLSGYLRFPGPLPAATIALDYVKRAQAAERFVPRGERPGKDADRVPAPEGEGVAVDTAFGDPSGEDAGDAQGELAFDAPPEWVAAAERRRTTKGEGATEATSGDEPGPGGTSRIGDGTEAREDVDASLEDDASGGARLNDWG